MGHGWDMRAMFMPVAWGCILYGATLYVWAIGDSSVVDQSAGVVIESSWVRVLAGAAGGVFIYIFYFKYPALFSVLTLISVSVPA